MMFRLKIPFQFKIYLLIFVLFAALMHLTTLRINGILTSQILNEENEQFKGLKTLFYNLLNSKIGSMENEALLLAEQNDLQRILRSQPREGEIHALLQTATPRIRRWPLMIITDRAGRAVGGKLVAEKPDNPLVEDRERIQKYLPALSKLSLVQQGIHLTSYLLIEEWKPASLFALSTVPVRSPDDPAEIIGTVTLGFPVDQAFALDLRSGSRYHIGFVLNNHIVTSTLDSTRTRDLGTAWDKLTVAERQALLDEPSEITLFDEYFLAFASPLPTVHGDQGFYVVLNSMEETLHSLRDLRHSVYWVSLFILSGTLVVGYVLARGVTAPIRTLADTVSHIAEGNYSVDINLRSGDELERLAHEIQHMAHTLERRETEIKGYIHEIEEGNKELEAKVAERTRDLEEKNIRLRMISEELGRAYAKIDDEFKIVGELQKRLLPSATFKRDGISIYSIYLPNGRAGGDYYDIITPIPDKIFILIADVSGHGTPAAFIMGITRAIAHTLIDRDRSPGDILHTLGNTLLKIVRAGEFVTMFLGCLDLRTQRFSFVSAGHPAPLLYRREQDRLEELEPNQGLPLGILENCRYEEAALSIAAGDRLLLYTDGIVEAFNEKRVPYGMERLQEVMSKNHDLPPSDLLELIMHDLEAYVQRPLDVIPLDDDVTLVAVDFLEVKIPVPSAGQ